jgi:hypothetical protein
MPRLVIYHLTAVWNHFGTFGHVSQPATSTEQAVDGSSLQLPARHPSWAHQKQPKAGVVAAGANHPAK